MPPIGTPVDLYWNLHRDVFSVHSRRREDYGLVIAHVDSFTVSDVEFVVRESGRQKVLRERRKNVHAFVRGLWAEQGSHEQFTGNIWRVKYSPYSGDSFMRHGSHLPESIHHADMAFGSIQYVSPVMFGYWK